MRNLYLMSGAQTLNACLSWLILMLSDCRFLLNDALRYSKILNWIICYKFIWLSFRSFMGLTVGFLNGSRGSQSFFRASKRDSEGWGEFEGMAGSFRRVPQEFPEDSGGISRGVPRLFRISGIYTMKRPWNPMKTSGTFLKPLNLYRSGKPLENHCNAPGTPWILLEYPETFWNAAEIPWKPWNPWIAPMAPWNAPWTSWNNLEHP